MNENKLKQYCQIKTLKDLIDEKLGPSMMESETVNPKSISWLCGAAAALSWAISEIDTGDNPGVSSLDWIITEHEGG